MCNLAGYAGKKNAAPILIEMLRQQQSYDGALSTGVATIHKGKLYYRKVVGDVDALLRETDALNLPGTIGIAHSRPAGDKNLPHPYISMDERMAVITNGYTPRNQYSYLTDNVITLLEEKGFKFSTEMPFPKDGFPSLKNGHAVSPAEARVHLTDYYIKELGLNMEDAMIKCSEEMFADNVYMTLSADYPDSISALRTTRPMNALLADGEVYLSTTVVGFPENVKGNIMSLPIFHVCTVTCDCIRIGSKSMHPVESVCEITPGAYIKAYDAVVEFLGGKEENPPYLDEIVDYVSLSCPDIWEEKHTYSQIVRLTYETLDRLRSEGKLKTVILPDERNGLTRGLIHFWL